MGELDRIGILGLGKMGSALLGGLLQENWDPEDLYVFDVRGEVVEELVRDHDVQSADSAADLAEETDVMVVCVKPKDVDQALSGVTATNLRVASIAAGVSRSTLAGHLPEGTQVIRVMPNTPAQVGQGMSFLAPADDVEAPFLETTRRIFEAVGECAVVSEDQMDAVTALSGSGPAYVFYLLESLYEAGVYMGLDHEQSLLAARQTLLGAATLARESERFPAVLRQEVSSPGGTTVEAIKHFDEAGLKGIIEEAVDRARQKSRELG